MLRDLEVISADRFRRGQGSPGCPHATDQVLMLGRAAAQSMQIAIEKFQRFVDPLPRSRISQGYTPDLRFSKSLNSLDPEEPFLAFR